MHYQPHFPGRLVVMIVDRYEPVNLFALVPQLSTDFEPELAGELPEDEFLIVWSAALAGWSRTKEAALRTWSMPSRSLRSRLRASCEAAAGLRHFSSARSSTSLRLANCARWPLVRGCEATEPRLSEEAHRRRRCVALAELAKA